MTTCYFLIDGKLIVVSSWKDKDEIGDRVRLWAEDYQENGDEFGRSLPDYIVDSINDTFVEGGGMTAMVVGYTTKAELLNEDE